MLRQITFLKCGSHFFIVVRSKIMIEAAEKLPLFHAFGRRLENESSDWFKESSQNHCSAGSL